MTGRALASRWHHLMRVASHVVDVAGELDAALRSVDVSPDPRALDGASTGYPEVVVMIDDPAHRAALAARLALPLVEWFRVPLSGDAPPGIETRTGDFQGVRVQLTGRMPAPLPEPAGATS